MNAERTELSPEITRGLRDSFREEAQGKIPHLMRWKDLQRLPDEIVAQSMIISSAQFLAKFEYNLALMPEARQEVQTFTQKFLQLIGDTQLMAFNSPFVYEHIYKWLLAGGVQAGQARYPYYEEFVPEVVYYLDKRNCFNPKFAEKAAPLLVRTPIDLGYAVGRGLVPDWIRASSNY